KSGFRSRDDDRRAGMKMWKRRFHETEIRIDVRLEGAVPFLVVQLFERVLPVLMRRVTDENVQMAELVHGALDPVVAEVHFGAVAFDDDAAALDGFDRLARLVG